MNKKDKLLILLSLLCVFIVYTTASFILYSNKEINFYINYIFTSGLFVLGIFYSLFLTSQKNLQLSFYKIPAFFVLNIAICIQLALSFILNTFSVSTDICLLLNIFFLGLFLSVFFILAIIWKFHSNEETERKNLNFITKQLLILSDIKLNLFDKDTFFLIKKLEDAFTNSDHVSSKEMQSIESLIEHEMKKLKNNLNQDTIDYLLKLIKKRNLVSKLTK